MGGIIYASKTRPTHFFHTFFFLSAENASNLIWHFLLPKKRRVHIPLVQDLHTPTPDETSDTSLGAVHTLDFSTESTRILHWYPHGESAPIPCRIKWHVAYFHAVSAWIIQHGKRKSAAWTAPKNCFHSQRGIFNMVMHRKPRVLAGSHRVMLCYRYRDTTK